MSRIDDLIAELCPVGVPYRALGELGEVSRGRRFTKADYVESGLPSIHYGEIYTDFGISTDTALKFVREELATHLRFAQSGDLIVAGTGENVEEVCKAVAWLGTGDVAVHDDCFIFRHQMDPVFISYVFQSAAFRNQKVRLASESKLVRVSASGLSRIIVPSPPLGLQREIVKILDAFADLEMSLRSERSARRGQRSAVVHMGGTVRSKTRADDHGAHATRLGDVVTQVVSPVVVEADQYYENLGLKWYGEGVFARPPKLGADIKANRLFAVQPGQFVYNRMFAIEGSFGLVPEELAHGLVSNEFPVYEVDETRLLAGWLLIYLQDDYVLKRIAAETTGVERGTMKSRRRWKESQFEQFLVPLPSLDEQWQVLHAHSLGCELEASLEAEIAARRQQYEHYRDRLLTFKPLDA